MIFLKKTAETAGVGKAASPGNLTNGQIGSGKQAFRDMNAPVMDRLLGHPTEFLLEQARQGCAMAVQLIGKEIHIQCRIVQIFPDQIKCGFHRIIIVHLLAPRQSQQLA